jgi:GTPase SAR1 family protein
MTADTVPNRARVAIIGLEGSGKTVLMSVMAHRFNDISKNGVFFNPLDIKTMRYVEQTWNTLCYGQWPASTPAGQLFELQWQILARVKGSTRVVISAHETAGLDEDNDFESNGELVPVCDLRFVDAAGQDLRRLFTSEDAGAIANLPGHLQQLWDYCRTADIVVCLVNLKDYLGEKDLDRKLDNEIFIKWALHQLSINRDQARRMILLFTQIDQYREYLAEKGGLVGVAKELFPLVYSAHLATGQVSLRAVAAVNDVEPAVDESGKPQRVPKKDFGSKGLNEFVQSIVEKAKTIDKAREEDKQQRAQSENRGRLQIQEQPRVALEHQNEDLKRSTEEVVKLEAQRNGIAGWFYLIAVLSIVNLLVFLMGGNWGMFIGLGITQLTDAFCLVVSEQLNPNAVVILRIIAAALTFGMAALFALLGFLTSRGKLWAIVVGMIIYAIDALIFLWEQNWVCLGFHVFVLWVLSGGLRTQILLNKMTTTEPAKV